MKSSKMSKGRNASEKVGNHWLNLIHWKRLNPPAMVTGMIKWLWGTPASKMLNWRLSKQGLYRLSVFIIGYFYYSVNLNQAAQNLWLLGRILACGLRLNIGGLELGLMCLAIAGVANQSRDQEPHILLCYSKKPHYVHYRWAHMNITPSFTHIRTFA